LSFLILAQNNIISCAGTKQFVHRVTFAFNALIIAVGWVAGRTSGL